eukprot:TRINITY_DN22504_c0_g1_i1.p2 TRINITY_DN22504_c0_g1~~TRINITY_DN22504_c0_g1_i1.p2  ORF type:complete len:159 (-),score=33.46 TRINITY_DN22504_c0_g1_i1:515-991(-)
MLGPVRISQVGLGMALRSPGCTVGTTSAVSFRGVLSSSPCFSSTSSASSEVGMSTVKGEQYLKMRVKAEGTNFGRLAGGLLARATSQQQTDVDALGDAAISNAVKAIALANSFAQQQESAFCLGFVPEMITEQAEDGNASRKLLRLSVHGHKARSKSS